MSEKPAVFGERLRKVRASARKALPGLRDLHVYGGGLLLAVTAWLSPWPWVAPGIFGALLLFLGLRVPARPAKPKPERGGG